MSVVAQHVKNHKKVKLIFEPLYYTGQLKLKSGARSMHYGYKESVSRRGTGPLMYFSFSTTPLSQPPSQVIFGQGAVATIILAIDRHDHNYSIYTSYAIKRKQPPCCCCHSSTVHFSHVAAAIPAPATRPIPPVLSNAITVPHLSTVHFPVSHRRDA